MLTLQAPSLAERIPVGPSGITGHWWVIHTKSRMEKCLASELRVAGIPHFLPIVTKIGLLHGRKSRIELPAFSGYLFVAVADKKNPCELDKIHRTKRVCALIPVLNQHRLISDLLRIETACIACPQLATDIKPGMRCVVRQGHAMEGSIGLVEESGHRGMVIVRVTMLGASTPLEIDPAYLQPADLN